MHVFDINPEVKEKVVAFNISIPEYAKTLGEVSLELSRAFEEVGASGPKFHDILDKIMDCLDQDQDKRSFYILLRADTEDDNQITEVTQVQQQ